METDTKRLRLLMRFIDVALLLIVLSIIYTIVRSTPYIGKFSAFSDRLPQSDRFDGIRSFMSVIAYFAILKVVIMRIVFGIVLLTIRKIVKAMLMEKFFGRNMPLESGKLLFSFYV